MNYLDWWEGAYGACLFNEEIHEEEDAEEDEEQ